MLTLLTFKPFLGTRAASPFGCKAEALLAMSGLPYTTELADVRKAPRGKFPVLKDGEKLIPDSAHIQAYLETEKGIDFDSHLTKQELATATAFRRLVEDHAYFLNMYFRWNDHPEIIKNAFFEEVPGLMRGFIFRMVQKNLLKTVHLQGLSRHSRAEMTDMLKDDMDAIATQLGDKPYFLGDKISSVDASVWGMLHGTLDCSLESPGKTVAESHKNLKDYCARISRELFDG